MREHRKKVPASLRWRKRVSGGGAIREQIWAAYYGDQGDFRDAARLLFDTKRGLLPESDNVWRAPYDPVDGTIWAVVHDNRGGAAWVVVPVHVR